MTLALDPACTDPTVTTAGSAGETSRPTMPCRRRTVAAAITTGSTLAWGIEPWAPRPNIVTSIVSPAEVITPGRLPNVPAGVGMTCWPRTTSGRGNRSKMPSSSIARAPSAVSSPGWKTAMAVPRQEARSAASASAAPTSQVTCRSWPQACITPSTVLA